VGQHLEVFLGTLLASISTTFPKPAMVRSDSRSAGILVFIGSLVCSLLRVKLLRGTEGQAQSALTAGPILAAIVVLTAMSSEIETRDAPANAS